MDILQFFKFGNSSSKTVQPPPLNGGAPPGNPKDEKYARNLGKKVAKKQESEKKKQEKLAGWKTEKEKKSKQPRGWNFFK